MCNLCKMFWIQQNRIENGLSNAHIGRTGPTARSSLWWWCILRSIRATSKLVNRKTKRKIKLTYKKKANQLVAVVPLNREHIEPGLLALIPVDLIPSLILLYF